MKKQHNGGAGKAPITRDNGSGIPAEVDVTPMALGEFAEHLDTARMLWRRYPELVEASEFPERFLPSLRECGYEPGGCELAGEDILLAQGILPTRARA